MSYQAFANWINLLLTIILGLLTVACTQEPSEQFLLMFEQRTEDLYQIYTVQPDGSELTKRLEFEFGKVHWLSPDGRHMAIFTWGPAAGIVPPGTSNGSLTILETMSGDSVGQIESVGETQTENLPISDQVIWSRKGDKLLFIRDSTNAEGTDIWLYDLNTGQTSQLTADNSFNWYPSWSPDEEQIAFMTLKACGESVGDCQREEYIWDLVIMDVDGDNKHVVTNFRDSELPPPTGNLLCGLSWSPDKQYIVMRDRCGWSGGIDYGGLAFLVKTDGSQIKRLTDYIEEVETDDSLLAPDTITSYTFDWLNSNNDLFIGYSTTKLEANAKVFTGFLIIDTNDLSYASFHDPFTKAGAGSRLSPNKQYVIGSSTIRYEDENDLTVVYKEIILASWDNNQGAILPITTQLPRGSYDESKIYWSPDSQYAAYTMAESDTDQRGIAIVSLLDGQVTNAIESFPGDSRPIGWISSKEIVQ